MNFVPSPNVVALRRIAEPAPKSSLLVIPETVQTGESIFAEVMAVGPLRTRTGVIVQPEIAVGDHVILPPHIGGAYEEDNVEYCIVRYTDILMKVSV